LSPGKVAVSWKPSRDVKLGSRLPTRVRPLFELCADVLVEYIEDVESLLGLPDSIKVRLVVHTKPESLHAHLSRSFTEHELSMQACLSSLQ